MTRELGGEAIGDRLAKIAHRLPDKVAIVERDTQITFRQLDADATAIARHLVAAGGSQQGIVGLLFEKKLPAVRAIFGVSRSGHAYVPLDPGDPDERLRFMLRDCDAIAVLTEGSLQHRSHAIVPDGCAIIDIERVQSRGSAPSPPAVARDASLCICYTSGSTGQPKGVLQTHRNLLSFADTYSKALGIGAEDRVSLLYTLSSGAANNNVFRALLHGATLCAYDMRRDGIPQLADWIDRQRITVLHTVPSAFREMATRLAPERLLPHLRVIHLGGEAVFASDVELFRKHTLKNCILINQLAATETGGIAQQVIDHRSPVPTSAVVPVGRCVEGVRVEIRRDDGSIADVNEAGDLVVCSAHVSPGYWHRPELDAVAFAPDPLQPGWRQYKSGDLGKIDEAGNLHFLGRKGARIKIRGHSVELMEVEAALSECPGVTRAAVVATGGTSPKDSARLIAYVEARPDAARDAVALRRHLATRLPSYMLPSGLAYVDALPLTASGKVDRNALARLDPLTLDPHRAVEPPQDDVERTVARVFQQLLKVAPIGREDDFFLLGGDSLLGVELQTRLREAFGVHVGILHQDATVAGIAAHVRGAISPSARRARPLPVLIPLWVRGNAPPLFLVHGRHGQAFVSAHFMRLLGDDQPVWALQARGLDGLREPHATVEDMAAEYLAEMLKQRPRGPYFLGSLCAGAYIVAVMARKLRETGEKVLPLLLLDPPNSPLHGGYSRLSEEQFISKMKARRAKGNSAGPVEDPSYMKALQRTAMAFERALARHEPLPYDGPVYVLSSHRRMQDPVGLRQIFTGRFKRYEVGPTHGEALDPRNPVFASSLLRCVGLIRDAASSQSAVYR